MSIHRLLGGLAAAAFFVAPAHAGDPTFEFGKADELNKVKGTEYNASAEAGLVFTAGNSETTTASAGLIMKASLIYTIF